VQRSHRSGQPQWPQDAVRPAQRHRKIGRRHTSGEELVVERGEDVLRGRVVVERVARGTSPQPQGVRVAIERLFAVLSGEGGSGRIGEIPERDEINHVGVGRQKVSVAVESQVRAAVPRESIGLEQPP